MKAITVLLATIILMPTAYAYEDLTDEWRRTQAVSTNTYTQPAYGQKNTNTVKQSKWNTSVGVSNNKPNIRAERTTKNNGKVSKISLIQSPTRLGASYDGVLDIAVKGTSSGFKVDFGKGW